MSWSQKRKHKDLIIIDDETVENPKEGDWHNLVTEQGFKNGIHEWIFKMGRFKTLPIYAIAHNIFPILEFECSLI